LPFSFGGATATTVSAWPCDGTAASGSTLAGGDTPGGDAALDADADMAAGAQGGGEVKKAYRLLADDGEKAAEKIDRRKPDAQAGQLLQCSTAYSERKREVGSDEVERVTLAATLADAAASRAAARARSPAECRAPHFSVRIR